MIGFSQSSQWSINVALYGIEKAEQLANESYLEKMVKFADLEESFKNFSILSFNDKIELCYYFLDTANITNELSTKIKNIMTPESRKFLVRGNKSSDKLKKLARSIIKPGAILILTKYNKISIEEKIHNCISLLFGDDLYGIITQVIINKDKEDFVEFYELLEITSSVMEQKQSFEVEKEVYKMWLATERNKKLESLLSDL
jgi:hypothetical protein